MISPLWAQIFQDLPSSSLIPTVVISPSCSGDLWKRPEPGGTQELPLPHLGNLVDSCVGRGTQRVEEMTQTDREKENHIEKRQTSRSRSKQLSCTRRSKLMQNCLEPATGMGYFWIIWCLHCRCLVATSSTNTWCPWPRSYSEYGMYISADTNTHKQIAVVQFL